jgi:hypothetical protein
MTINFTTKQSMWNKLKGTAEFKISPLDINLTWEESKAVITSR